MRRNSNFFLLFRNNKIIHFFHFFLTPRIWDNEDDEMDSFKNINKNHIKQCVCFIFMLS